jgi:serine/threonine protein kinase
MDLLPGTMISKNLRLKHHLGCGGMGMVWVADHLSLRSKVAVKFVLATLGVTKEQTAARFAREAAAAAKLRHPNVVQILDHGQTHDGTPFIVMELLEGQDLASRIEREGALDMTTAVAVIAQTSRALSAAHARGLVHRDVKPENIFLTDLDGELLVKVLDFGVAKDGVLDGPGALTASGAMIGTPRYASPEQMMDAKSVDHRTDLWSLAVVAYECITGVRPFEADSVGKIVVLVHAGTFAPARTIRPELPPAVDIWFSKALSRDPSARFSSAKEFAASFHAAVRGLAPDCTQGAVTGDSPGSPVSEAESLQTKPSSTPSLERATMAAVSPKIARKGALAAVFVGAAVLLLITFVVIMQLSNRDDAEMLIVGDVPSTTHASSLVPTTSPSSIVGASVVPAIDPDSLPVVPVGLERESAPSSPPAGASDVSAASTNRKMPTGLALDAGPPEKPAPRATCDPNTNPMGCR